MAKKILIIRFGSLGDIILTSPTVLNLKLAFPHSHIVFVTKSQFAPVVSLFDGVDEVCPVPTENGAIHLYRYLLELDRRNFDLVVDLHGNFRSCFARNVISAGEKTVYPKRRFDRHRIVWWKQFPEPEVHTIDSYNLCLQRIGIATPCARPLIPVVPARRSDGSGATEVVVAPGAAHPNKQWPTERFAEVALQLATTCGSKIVWVTTGSEAGRSGLSGKLAPHQFSEIVDAPIPELAVAFARATVAVSNDSGLMHLASAVGTPVLGIFGPTHPALGFGPKGLWDQTVEVDEPCRPCSLHGKKPCYRTERFCFTRISAEMVIERLVDMCKAQRQRTAALFLDRDGTLIVDKDYLADPDQVELIPGAVDALRMARGVGYKLVVISNQSGVARGMFGTEAVEQVNARLVSMLAAQGAPLDSMQYCPHYPGGSVPGYSVQCGCRKPAPGMAETAARELGIDLRRSWVIGDKIEDLSLGRLIGARSVLVRTGHGAQTERSLPHSSNGTPSAVVDSIADIGNLLS